MKVSFKIFGSLYHSNDSLLMSIGNEGYFFAAVARMVSPIIMQKIGFFKTYSGCLIIEIILASTMTTIAPSPILYRVWVILSLMCEGTHFSIFPPLSGAIYGPV
jgi:hypothetical protein